MNYSEFSSQGFLSAGFLAFVPKVAYQKSLQGAIILDIRESKFTAYKKFDVPEVIYLPFSNLNDRLSELSTEKCYIVADSTGLFSRRALEILKENGFTLIVGLAGGIVEWEHDGLPLVVNRDEQLDGSCVCQLRPRLRMKKDR